MSSICGIVNFSSSDVPFERLRSMGSKMRCPEDCSKGAYGWQGACFMEVRDKVGKKVCVPSSVCCDGHKYIVLLDGKIRNLAELATDTLGESDEKRAAECYSKYGRECVKHFCGEFVLVIYDELYKEVFFASDRRGARSLYYYFDGTTLVFASEIKGILGYIGEGAEVDAYALAEQIMSDRLMLRSDEIYKSIYELPASSYALFSPLGIQVCGYPAWKEEERELSPVCLELDFSNLGESLYSALLAFDYPVFDEYICSLISYLKRSAGVGEIPIADAFMGIDTRYSYFRADRLGRQFGVSLIPCEAKKDRLLQTYSLWRAEKKLSAMAEDLFAGESRQHPIFDKDICERIARKKDMRCRIQAYGRLIQSVYWLEKYRVIPV